MALSTENFILNTDSYKPSQFLQYPPNTEYISSYIEARKDSSFSNEVLFFGLQAFLKQYFTDRVITQDSIDEAKRILIPHGVPFNQKGWDYILKKHNGTLPLRIQAVPEGMCIQNKNILLQITNTDPNCAWLVSYVETALLRAVWYPSTVATLSRSIKKIIKENLEQTGGLENLNFKLHDFGYRGVSSQESGFLGGMAHLVNFLGTDTIGALTAIQKFYNSIIVEGFSIPASEHSSMSSWGTENETNAFENMIKQFGDSQIFACVSDTYDIWNAVENIWGSKLKEKVETMKALLVVRPDSGDPVETPILVVERLAEKFGYIINSQGYKVLKNVRVIQGDGINIQDVQNILDLLKERGFSGDNIAFGMGGALLQGVTRDTCGFSMKASEVTVDGKSYDIYKNPIGSKMKCSKKGRLKLIRHNTDFLSVKEEGNTNENILKDVFRNGKLLIDDDWNTIKKRASL